LAHKAAGLTKFVEGFVVKVLFVVPHYYRGMGVNTRYASHSVLKKEQRIQALDRLIYQLYALFGPLHVGTLDHASSSLANMRSITQFEFDIVICTTGKDHLLYDISCPSLYYHHVDTKSEPIWLGFAAQRKMLELSGQYDYYCYLEDDIIINDPYFFIKLDYFNSQTPEQNLLLPHRYETPWIQGKLKKHYYSKLYSDLGCHEQGKNVCTYNFDFLGRTIKLKQPALVHSGCYFLTARQFEIIAETKEFANCEGIPLERALDLAASNAIGHHFVVFKADECNLDFFEVEHGVGNMFDQIKLESDGRIKWDWSHEGFDYKASEREEQGRLNYR